jgi:deoxyinosine 3'endonuclease (endonuclease V)
MIAATHGVGMRAEVRLASPPVRHVCVELGRGQVGVAKHLLHAAQVRAALQKVRRERVTKQMGVYTLGLEAGGAGELAQDQECAGTRQSATVCVQEQLWPVPAVEVWPSAR